MRTIDEDPWGRPYKIVMNKLRAPARPICEALQPEVIKDIVEKLFSQGSKVQKYVQEDPSEVPEIHTEELIPHLKKIKSNKKAPGPDGVTNQILAYSMVVLIDLWIILYNK